MLHSIPNNGSTDFSALPLFESWLRDHAEVRIVISSSWREIMTLEVLKAIFSQDLQDRIIDKCPTVEFIGQQEYWRYLEILQWLEVNDYSGSWLALDDMETAFPVGLAQLVACYSTIGIDENVIRELNNKVFTNDHLS